MCKVELEIPLNFKMVVWCSRDVYSSGAISTTNNQVTEAPNVLMATDDYKYLELPNSQLELMNPLGWEVKRLQQPSRYDSSTDIGRLAKILLMFLWSYVTYGADPTDHSKVGSNSLTAARTWVHPA